MKVLVAYEFSGIDLAQAANTIEELRRELEKRGEDKPPEKKAMGQLSDVQVLEADATVVGPEIKQLANRSDAPLSKES